MGIANIVNGHAERFVPAMKEFGLKTIHEHLHRYTYASQFVNGKCVLDIACGEGYGSWILADAAMEVVGVDKDNHVIEHAQLTYKKDNLKFVVGNLERLPFGSGEFDVVVCFEAIEHVIAQEECIAEARRVLRDNGVLLVSTPPIQDSKKNGDSNPFHLKGLTSQGFKKLLCENFEHVRFVGQEVIFASFIHDISDIDRVSDCIELFYERNDNGYVRILNKSNKRHSDYLLAIASNKDINLPPKSILMNAVENEVDKLLNKVNELEKALGCAGNILKKKQEVSSRHLRKLRVSELEVANLKEKLTKKDSILQKVLSHTYRIIPMNIKTKPSIITDKISAIIPVKNGGEQLRRLLQKIRLQKKVQDMEIIVIDSESTDNSVDTATEYGAKVIKIPQKEFNHGATRNLGAKEANGDYLVFIVQDAMPVNDYWLYNMICPFIEYPELSALSSKQFVKPEADLFSAWQGESLIKSFGLEGDTIYSLSDIPKGISIEFFDSVTKRRLTFFDNVSSCVRKSLFKEMQFSPLINAEDIDYGVRLLEKKKVLGYLTSTGVYHWHERGADYLFKRYYIGTKAEVYTLKNDLQYFYDRNNIGWGALAANITGLYDLIGIAVVELKNNISPELMMTVRSFVNALQKNIETTPHGIEERLKEKGVYGEDGLNLLLREVIGEKSVSPEQKYNFKHNFLISDFMKHFENFTKYLYSRHQNLKGREDDFISCLYKIFAMTAGYALGTYYIEAEALNRLTPDLRRLDLLLKKGICHF